MLVDRMGLCALWGANLLRVENANHLILLIMFFFVFSCLLLSQVITM